MFAAPLEALYLSPPRHLNTDYYLNSIIFSVLYDEVLKITIIFRVAILISKFRQMKRLLIFSLVIFAIFSSCKKNNPSANPGNYITATVNGSNLTFNIGAEALVESSSAGYRVEITGREGVAYDASQILVVISGSSPIPAGVYSNGTAGPDQVSLLYALTNVAAYQAVGVGPSVTITSITGTNVQGTFNGVLMLASGSTAASTATITNGKFNVAVNK
jgi:hypothetical protein